MARHQFTREQVYEMADALSRIGSKDTEFAKATSILGTDIMTIVQDGVNKQVDMTTLFAKILELVDPETPISLEGLLHYWDGTSDEYEALEGTRTDNTLYCIKEDDSSVISKLYKGDVPIRLIAYVQPTFTDFYLMDASGKLVDVTKKTTYNVTKIHVSITNKACLKGTAKLYYNTNVAGYQVLIDTVDLSKIVDDVVTLTTPQEITLESGKSASFYLSGVDEQNVTIKSNTFSVKCNYSDPSVTVTSMTLKSATPTVSTTMAILDKMTLAYTNTDYLDTNGTIKIYTKVGSTSSYPTDPIYTTAIYKDGAFVTSLDLGNDSSQGATTGIIQGCTVYAKVVVTSTTGAEFSYEISKTIGYSTLGIGSFTASPSVTIGDIYYLKEGTTESLTTKFAISGFTNYENLKVLQIFRSVNGTETNIKQWNVESSGITEATLLAQVKALTDTITIEPKEVVTYCVKLTGLFGSGTTQTKTFGTTTYNIGMWKHEKTTLTLNYVGGTSVPAAGGTYIPTYGGGVVSKVYYNQVGTKVSSTAITSYTDDYSSSSAAIFVPDPNGAVTVAENTNTTSRSAVITLTRYYNAEVLSDLGVISASFTMSQLGITVAKKAVFQTKYSQYLIADVEGATTLVAALADADFSGSIISGTTTSEDNATTTTVPISSASQFFGFIMPSNITLTSVTVKNTAGSVIMSSLSDFTYEETTIGNIYHLGASRANAGGTIVFTYTFN